MAAFPEHPESKHSMKQHPPSSEVSAVSLPKSSFFEPDHVAKPFGLLLLPEMWRGISTAPTVFSHY